ncbi:MAG: 1-deoxy-D-xylulose-5-phosphate synthase [Hyphomicrobiaceae bacterium]
MSIHKSRIMYIESKAHGLEGLARIGRVTYSKSGRSVTYGGRTFAPMQGFKANYYELDSHAAYWISGPKRRGGDRLYGTGRVEIDDDVREEYWTAIREEPHRIAETFYRD